LAHGCSGTTTATHRVHHLSLWDSVDAIRAFAGDDIDAVVLYPEDARYLVGESTVTHHQIVDQVEPAPGQAREPSARSRRAACTGPACMRRRREPPAPSRSLVGVQLGRALT
jgi:hypothetical protein